jgi:hypothetical protein
VGELSQKTLGRVRDALYALEPEGEYSSAERREFWRNILFDEGLATGFIDIAATYDFNWTNILPHLYTGKFGTQNQTFATLIPPSVGELYLNKLVVFALEQNKDTPMEEGIRKSLRDDGFAISSGSQTRVPPERAELPTKETPFDVFISHATEDKPYVEPLVKALEAAGIRVWFDKSALEWGDDLRSSIDRGLANCRYGIVVFSKAFLGRKKWTEYELNSLFALEQSSRKVILPIWHGITHADLIQYSPAFADRLAKISSTDSYGDIVESLLEMLGRSKSQESHIANGTLQSVPEPMQAKAKASADASTGSTGENPPRVDAFAEDLEQQTRQAVGYSMTFSGQQLLRQLLMHDTFRSTQQIMPEISMETQNEQMKIAKKAGIVKQEPGTPNVAGGYYTINPRFLEALGKVLYEELAKHQ